MTSVTMLYRQKADRSAYCNQAVKDGKTLHHV